MKLICDCHPRTEEAPRAPNSSPAAACPLATLGPPVGGQSDAAAPPTSASLNIRRPHDEYGESEYGGLPVEYAAFVTMLRPREFQCPISTWLAGRSESVLIRNRCLFLNGVGIGAKSPTPAAGRLRAPETTHLSALVCSFSFAMKGWQSTEMPI
jgi:hypothetical protein